MKRDRAIRYALDNGIFSPGELTLPEIAAQLNECHRQFLSSARSTFEAAWRGGGLVLMAKGRLPHGGLLPWLETETELSERRARAWMRIHVKVPITAVTADLKIESCLKQIAFQPRGETDYSERDARLMARATALPDKTYHIILADPPWRYEHAPAGDPGRSIEAHYPTMSLEELGALNISEIAAPDCLLYLWVTSPKLAESIWLLSEWGFDYRTSLTWVKDKIGTGYYARAQHELVLIAKRGQMPPPAPELRRSSVIFADRAQHSEKPTELYERIEEAYPDFSKIELFSRTPREGWDAWGYEAVNVA